MGTTLTALRFTGRQVGLVHVGDSRAYLLRNDHLSQITHDDTYVQSLVDSGRLTPEEAHHHPRKSVILRALMGSEVEPDVSIREARAGDRYLLCTDGLSDVVTATTIQEALSEGEPAGVRRPARRPGAARRRPGQRHLHRRRRRRHRVRRRPAGDRRCVRRSHECAGQRWQQPSGTSGADDPAGHRAAAPSRPHAPAAVEADRHHPGRARRACRRGRRVLRLDPDPVLRRQGRQRGRDLPGRQRRSSVRSSSSRWTRTPTSSWPT